MGVTLAGHFQVERQLGEGGMAVVWAATDQRTGERVAIKCLKPGLVHSDAKRRLKREARSIAAIGHPNVVRVREVVTLEDGAPAIVMELLEGESLGARLDRAGRLSLAETARIMLPTISAVGTAHALGIVHRDLKPDNIFLAKERGTTTVRVLDFGIAKVMAESDAFQSGALTSTGAMVGTPYYMAPEQVFGERDLDARVDVWALGVVLFECLTGRRPIEGDNAGQVLRAITTGKVERLSTTHPDLPHDVTAIVDRMLTPDRALRPPDLREIYALLDKLNAANAIAFGPATTMSAPKRVFGRSSRIAGLVLGVALLPVAVAVSRFRVAHGQSALSSAAFPGASVAPRLSTGEELSVATITRDTAIDASARIDQQTEAPAATKRPRLSPAPSASVRLDRTTNDFDRQ